MKTYAKQLWRIIKRHPLSAKYSDIAGIQWMQFCDGMKSAAGFRKDKPVILLDGMVIDGWQRLRACIETNTEPVFADMPDDMTPKDFVRLVNDHRRHETPEQAAARIAERQERVVEARGQGESFQAIAEKEEISEATARRDSEKVPGPSCDGPGNTTDKKTTGKDGKKYPAAKPVMRCSRCTRLFPSSTESTPGCKECERLQGKKPKAEEPPDFEQSDADESIPPDAIVDDDGIPVPAKLREVFADVGLFRSASMMCAKTAIALKKVEGCLAYRYEDRQAEKEKTERRLYSTHCRTAEQRMIGLRPAKVCCTEGCKKCGQKGFLTQGEIEK